MLDGWGCRGRASTSPGNGLMTLADTWWPRNSTVEWENVHFGTLRTRPAFEQLIHEMLKCHASVFESIWHRRELKKAKRSDEHSFGGQVGHRITLVAKFRGLKLLQGFQLSSFFLTRWRGLLHWLEER